VRSWDELSATLPINEFTLAPTGEDLKTLLILEACRESVMFVKEALRLMGDTNEFSLIEVRGILFSLSTRVSSTISVSLKC